MRKLDGLHQRAMIYEAEETKKIDNYDKLFYWFCEQLKLSFKHLLKSKSQIFYQARRIIINKINMKRKLFASEASEKLETKREFGRT